MDTGKNDLTPGMNLLGRFSLLLGVSLLLFGLLLGQMISSYFERTELAREKDYLAKYIQNEVAHRHLPSKEFTFPKTGQDYETFRLELQEIIDFRDVLRVVIFSPEGTVVWSDFREMVGRRPASRKLGKALGGEIEAELTTPGREGYPFPAAPKELLELYVPIRGKTAGSIIGVVKIYQNADPLRTSIRNAVRDLWVALGSGFSVLFLVLFGIVRKGHRLILSGQKELRDSREKIRAQNLERLWKIGASVRREGDPAELLAEVAKEIRRQFDLPRSVIRIFGDPDLVVEDRDPGVPSAASVLPGSFRADDSEEILRTGRTLVVEDAQDPTENRNREESVDRIGLGACLGVPLQASEGILGILFLERAMPHRWTREEVETAEMVAGQVAMAIRQARVFQEREETGRRLLALMNNVPGMVYRGYPDWSVGFMGAEAEEITGYTAEEFLNRNLTWKDMIPPEDIESIVQSMRESIRRKDPLLRVEYRILQKDGSRRWVADRRQLVYDAGGRLLHIDGLVLDITDRKKSEETLRLIEFTIDRAGDAAYWMDPDGRFLYVNETFCAAIGYSREELLSMTIREINPDFLEESWRSHWEEIRRRKSFLMETRHRAKDGRVIPVEVTVNHLEFGGKEYNCAFARDITERLRVREESARLQDQLLQSQKMESLGILAGGVAHDFNNLLTGILGYADLLDREAAPGSRTSEAARVIRESAERASRLTAQLLGFARKGKNLTVALDLRKISGDVVQILERTLDRRIRILPRFPDSSATVLGDPTQLFQVVMNLGMNAGDSMPEGGDLTVSIERRILDPEFCLKTPGLAPGPHVVLSVGDTGSGIPEKDLPRIFEPFFTTKEQGKGSGLGLSMAFGIVKNHGGTMSIRTREGIGTTVTVYLPDHAGEATERVSPWIPADSRPGEKGVVLLVDDEETVREVCTSMLEVLGYEVIQAENGQEGVEVYRARWQEIDLVILDMMMPKMGGRDCFRRIREINPQARALLSSGYSLDGTVQEILGEGMEGFIQKPFRLEQLEGAVYHALQRAS